MKKLLIISLALISLTLGQWGSLEHAFHKHVPGEQCDYCLSAKSLDHGLITTPLIAVGGYSITVEAASPLLLAGHRSHRHYPVRAPPHST
jgi:hypothetical protein